MHGHVSPNMITHCHAKFPHDHIPHAEPLRARTNPFQRAEAPLHQADLQHHSLSTAKKMGGQGAPSGSPKVVGGHQAYGTTKDSELIER